ncbi:hypothetical protein OGAPHI_007045 [Ogataea philodendri]|uniref:Uncharacterized protein n=1 Tax=Ogataea philodendri TaxID=1378263 RepID=A0A9P8NW04_9ASCO|nr:uncharacterized protein OGAPHI_007045 [Ogataea philodendri]KAH3660459.1 hypothetical protein OGAPHI_007045 [Ogataea philodendri]
MPDFVDSVFDHAHQLVKETGRLASGSADFITSIIGKPIPPPSQTNGSPLFQIHTKRLSKINLKVVFFTAIVGGLAILELHRKAIRHRRANLLPNGRRFEVILIIGSPVSVVVQKLVNDLNRRGYIVYVTARNETEVKAIESERDADIKPLLMNFECSSSVKSSLLRFASILETPESTSNEIEEGKFFLHFKGSLIIPDYFRYPKYSRLVQIEKRELDTIIENQFWKINGILQNGLLSILQESNSRISEVESYNGVKVGCGGCKLIFINFVPMSIREKRRLFLEITLKVNDLLYDQLYEENSKHYNGIPFLLPNKNPDFIQMTRLRVNFFQDEESKLLTTRLDFQSILSFFGRTRNKKLTPKRFHHQIFDLLNSNLFYKNYTIQA